MINHNKSVIENNKSMINDNKSMINNNKSMINDNKINDKLTFFTTWATSWANGAFLFSLKNNKIKHGKTIQICPLGKQNAIPRLQWPEIYIFIYIF